MATNSIVVSGTVTDTDGVTQIGPYSVTGATTPGPGAQTTISVASGNNAITVPSAARGVIIIPTNVTSSPLLLKGPTSADAGLAISPTQPTGPLMFDPNNLPATLNVNSTTTAGTLQARWV